LPVLCLPLPALFANLLEPETDQGVPGGPDKSEAAPPAGEAMKAKPEGETKEIEKEEGK
jgi:hypothetical protein